MATRASIKASIDTDIKNNPTIKVRGDVLNAHLDVMIDNLLSMYDAEIGGVAATDGQGIGWDATNLKWGPITIPGAASYTQGSILFGDTDGSIAQDNANLFFDNTNDRLGIGVNSSLGAKLQVRAGVGETIFLGENSSGVDVLTITDEGKATWAGTWSAGANNQSGISITQQATARATVDDTISVLKVCPELVQGEDNQKLIALDINPTYTTGGHSDSEQIFVRLGPSTGRFMDLRVNNTFSITRGSGNKGISFVMSDALSDSGSVNYSFQGANITNDSGTTDFFEIIGGGITGDSLGRVLKVQGNPTGGNGDTVLAYIEANFNGSIATSRGALDIIQISSTNEWNPSSGADDMTAILVDFDVEQSGTASGNVIGLDYNPTETALLGENYAILARRGLSGFGMGATLPTAMIQVRGRNNGTALLVQDDAGNAIIEAGESGGARVLGFYGATVTTQPTSSGAATATGSWTSTEQDMLQEVYDAVRALGLMS